MDGPPSQDVGHQWIQGKFNVSGVLSSYHGHPWISTLVLGGPGPSGWPYTTQKPGFLGIVCDSYTTASVSPSHGNRQSVWRTEAADRKWAWLGMLAIALMWFRLNFFGKWNWFRLNAWVRNLEIKVGSGLCLRSFFWGHVPSQHGHSAAAALRPCHCPYRLTSPFRPSVCELAFPQVLFPGFI